MNFQVKMSENGRKNRLTEKETTNMILLMFLDPKAVTDR